MSVVRNEPRISVNKLGEYLVASPRRRRSIIKAQKKPSDFVVARYQHASEPIIQYLLSDFSSTDPIIKGIRACRSAVPNSDWDEQDLTLSNEALMAFLNITDQINFHGTTREATDLRGSAGMVIAGVYISVRPEIMVYSSDRKGRDICGAIKLLFSKSFPLDSKSGEYVTTILRQYIGSTMRLPVDNSMCSVIDVFAKKIYYAPKTYRRSLNEIEAACEEISSSWKAI